MTHTTFDPKKLAKQAMAEIDQELKRTEEGTGEGILHALQNHYDKLERNQRMYIEYLSEFINKLQETRRTDIESVDELKKQVLKHVIQNEKARSAERED